MANGEYEFDALISSIDREIRDLKTAHRRPLGALDFFTLTENIQVNLTSQFGQYYAEFWVDVTIDTPDATPPIVQTGWDTPSNFSSMDLASFSVNASYTVWSYKFTLVSSTQSSAAFNVTATSSLPVKSIGLRA